MKLPNLLIYLSGSIKKGTSVGNDSSYWTESHTTVLSQSLETVGYNAIYLNPASRSDDASDERSVFGRDMLQVYLSDLVLADMREKRGIGIGYELALANFKRIPVVSWAPMCTHYRLERAEILGRLVENWVHPFVAPTSQQIVEELPQISTAISHISLKQKIPLTDSDYVFNAIIYYLRTQYARDKEMREIIQQDARAEAEVQRLLSMCQQAS